MGKIAPKELRKICLFYKDGSVICVPEDKSLRVGTAFMEAVGREQFDWDVVKIGTDPSSGFFATLVTRVKQFLTI